jgi:hypothetical protein
MKVGTIREIWRHPVKSMGGERLSICRIERTHGIPGDRGWAVWDVAAGEVRNAKKFSALLQCTARYCAEPVGASAPTVEVRLPDGSLVRTDAQHASARLSEALDRSLRFVARRPADDLDHYRRAEKIEDLGAEVRIQCGLLPDEPLPDFGDVRDELLEFVSPPGTYFDGFEIHALTTASLSELARLSPSSEFDARRFRPNLVIQSPADVAGFTEFDWCDRELRIGDARLAVVQPMMRCAMVTWAQDDLPEDPSVMRLLVREAQQNLGVALSVISPGEVALGDPVELVEQGA